MTEEQILNEVLTIRWWRLYRLEYKRRQKETYWEKMTRLIKSDS